MKKMSFLVIGLLVISIVIMSGCADKTSDTAVSVENNSGNVSLNNTIPQGGENPGNMSLNENMPPEGNPGEMPSNATMPPEGKPDNNSTMPPGGVTPAGSLGEMQNSSNESQ